MIPLKCSVFLSCNLRRFCFSNVEILAVPRTSFIYSFRHLGRVDHIFVGINGLDAIERLGKSPLDQCSHKIYKLLSCCGFTVEQGEGIVYVSKPNRRANVFFLYMPIFVIVIVIVN